MYGIQKNIFFLEKREWGEKNSTNKSRTKAEQETRQQRNIIGNKQNNAKSYLFVKSFKHFRNSKYAKNAIRS